MRQLRKEYSDEAEFQKVIQRAQLRDPIKPGTLHHVLDHIDHIVHVAGVDHVGLGSDFDGVNMLPAQLEDVSAYPLITQELHNRGYTEQEIHQIMSGNVMRVFRDTELVAKQLSR
jgi:membrane dipeptidase